MADIAAGFGIDFSKINKELKEADKRLEVFAESAEKQMKRVRDAFELSGTKGLKQLQAELTNTYSKMSKLAEKHKIEFRPSIDGTASQKVIDDINKIVNLTRQKFEELNSFKFAGILDTKEYNDIEKLADRLATLQNALSTGRWQEGDIDAPLTNKQRVTFADEIAAIQERLKVLRMSSAEFQELKSKEIQKVISNAQIEEDLAQKKKKEYEEELRALKKLEAEKARIESQNRAKAYARTQRSGDTSGQALAAYNRLYSDKGVMSIQRMNEALSKMRSAQEKLNLNTEQGKKKFEELDKAIKRVEQDLNKATNSSKRLTNEHNSLVEVGKKLTTRFAQLFSVQAIVGYANKVKEIRGEFEMQHRAMQALIGDVDKANALWDKTISLAVKSPFKVRDLVTYTKQLSAYRIETDKLYEKTKMLADISAGLGVDMNRLILAYGQVKAANYLRGTELRQFSEAGINILEELSIYFSKLEGRAVSVGDVFERVSKRLVSFADVDAVLQKVTSEGGAFYQMQEKQSETLRGMSMNLTDSIELMMNDLGKRNDDILKGSINILKTVIDNWRVLEPAITSAGIALITYFPLKKLGDIGAALAKIPAAFASHPIAIIAAGIAAISVAIYKVASAQSKLNAELSEIDTNISKSLRDDIASYHKLADTISDATASTEEYENAKSQLKSRFAEILPDQELEAEYIKGLAGDYKAAEDAMFAYYNAKARAQKEDKIRQTYSEGFDTDISDLKKGYTNFIERYIGGSLIDKKLGEILLSSVSGSVNNAFLSMESGEINPDELFSTINENISKFADFDFSTLISNADMTSAAYMKISRNVRQLAEDFEEMNNKISNLKGLPTETYEEQVIGEQINAARKNIDETKSAYKSAVNAYAEYIRDVEKVGGVTEENLKITNGKISDILDSITNEQYKTKLSTIFDTLWSKAQQGSFAFYEVLQQSESDLQKYLADIVLSSFQVTDTSSEVAKRLYLNFSQELGKEAKNLNLNSFQTAVIEGAKGIAEKFGVDVNLFSKFIPNSQETLSNVTKELEGYIKQWEERIEKFDSSSSVEEYGGLAPDILTETTEEIEKMKESMPALNEFAKLLGIIFKDKSKKEPELFTKQLAAIRELYEAYKELMKTSTEAQSKEGAWEKVGDAWMEAFQKTPEQIGFTNFFSEAGVTEAFDWLVDNAPDVAKKVQAQLAKSEFILEGEVRSRQEDQENVRNEIENMFGSYEVTMEMEKLHIPTELASRLFDFTPTSLDDIRDKVQAEIDKIKVTKGQEDQLKALEEFLKRVDKLEKDALKERMTYYIEYSKKTLGERAKIKVDEINQLNEIEKTFKPISTEGIDDAEELKRIAEENRLLKEQGEIAKKAVQDKAFQQMKQIEWDEFRSSDVFNNMFNDLDKASEMSINAAIKRIQDFKKEWKDMPVAAAKEMLKKLNELQLALYDSSNIRKDKKKIEKELNKEIENRELRGKANTTKGQKNLSEAIQGENQAYTEIIEKSNKRIELLQLINSLEGTNKQEQLNKLGYTIEYLDALGITTEMVENTTKANGDLIKGEQDIVDKKNEQIASNQQILNLITKQKSKAAELGEKWSKMLGMAKDLYTSFQDLSEAANWDFSDEMAIFGEMGVSMADAVVNAIALSSQLAAVEVGAMKAGTALNTALGIVGFIVMAVQLVASALNAISTYQQEKRAKAIEDEMNLVEELAEKYEKLNGAIDKAYSSAKLTQDSKDAQDNLKKQIKATERAIAVYEDAGDAKLTDEEKEDWEEKKKNLEDLKEKAEELKETIFSISTGGVLDDVASAANSFVDAWLTAFEDTENGMTGLEESFDDMLKTILKQQMSLSIMGPFINDMKTELGKYLNENDTTFTANEAALWVGKVNEGWEGVNANMEAYLNALEGAGIDLFKKENELSGLSGGIQGITEEQADILAAYWNQVRFDVSGIRQKLEDYASKMFSDTENPMLEQLKSIVKQTTAIASNTAAISGLIQTNGSDGSDGIRVYVNNM